MSRRVVNFQAYFLIWGSREEVTSEKCRLTGANNTDFGLRRQSRMEIRNDDTWPKIKTKTFCKIHMKRTSLYATRILMISRTIGPIFSKILISFLDAPAASRFNCTLQYCQDISLSLPVTFLFLYHQPTQITPCFQKCLCRLRWPHNSRISSLSLDFNFQQFSTGLRTIFQAVSNISMSLWT